jgi:predicted anti-sigma-YlaC factor YlaD
VLIRTRFLSLLFVSVLLSGCIRRYAINKLGDALASGGSTFASDNDPDLVGDALPFSLKLIESLLAESPNHRGLLLAAASGFTQYSYGWVQQPADELEPIDLDRATRLRARAARLFLRARDYGLRGLGLGRPALAAALRDRPAAAVASLTRREVPLLYWTAAAWGAAIALSKDKPEVVADQPIVEALIDRALALDESFDEGAIHAFLIAYEPARIGASAEQGYARSRQHFERAVELSRGRQASVFVSFAEAVPLARLNRAEFTGLLNRALAVDPDALPERRLANLISQRRARWLLSRADELF